jgi:uncharacterized protein YaaN involved in tellurite resistance
MGDPDSTPLDLSSFTDLAVTPTPGESPGRAVAVNAASPPAEILQPLQVERLVDPASLDPARLEQAQKLAGTIDFAHTLTTITFIEGTLQPVAAISRQLLSDTQVRDVGEVGRVAAAVIDGIKILRIEDLQNEAKGIAPKAAGFLSKALSLGRLAKSAIASFEENRKKFLTLMDQEEARARKIKADLMVTVDLLDQQAQAVRTGISDLTVGIAAAQLALDRGYGEAESLRQTALGSNNPADAAVAMEFRNTLNNFKGRVADIRQAMISSAALVPIIALNRKSAETRVAKLSNGILLTIPRLMAAASQAAAQADIHAAANESEKLDEADRKVMALVGQGTHDAAVSAARSLAGDPRNIEALAALAQQTIATMNEVLVIEQEVDVAQKEQEQKLIDIRNQLVKGMTEVQAKILAKPLDQAGA